MPARLLSIKPNRGSARVLEGEVRRAINMVGLEPSIGWLHEFTGAQTRESCVYDLMEPFRWLADFTTMEAFESGAVDLKDFYFTGDDYSYKIEIEAKRRLLQLLKERFNSGVKYKDHVLKWDTVIEQNTTELARYLTGRSRSLDFSEPRPELEKTDTPEIRKRISLSQNAAGKSGARKHPLLLVKADGLQIIRTYRKVRDRSK